MGCFVVSHLEACQNPSEGFEVLFVTIIIVVKKLLISV